MKDLVESFTIIVAGVLLRRQGRLRCSADEHLPGETKDPLLARAKLRHLPRNVDGSQALILSKRSYFKILLSCHRRPALYLQSMQPLGISLPKSTVLLELSL